MVKINFGNNIGGSPSRGGGGGLGNALSYILQDGETDKGLQISSRNSDIDWCLEAAARQELVNATRQIDSRADTDYLTVTAVNQFAGETGNDSQIVINGVPADAQRAMAVFTGSGGGTLTILAPAGSAANEYQARIRLGSLTTAFWDGDGVINLTYFSGATIQQLQQALNDYNVTAPAERIFGTQVGGGASAASFASSIHTGTDQTVDFEGGLDAGAFVGRSSTDFRTITLTVTSETTLTEIKEWFDTAATVIPYTAAITGNGGTRISQAISVPLGGTNLITTRVNLEGGIDAESILFSEDATRKLVIARYAASDTIQELLDASSATVQVKAVKSTDLTLSPEAPTFPDRTFNNVGLNPDPGPMTALSGLTQTQVDGRVRAGVEDWAEQGNADAIPASKLTNAPSGGGGGVDETQVRDLIANWAEQGNTDLIPANKLTNAPSGGGGLTQDQVDERVTEGVANWAEEGNTDLIPANKLTNAPSGGDGLTEEQVRGFIIDGAEEGGTARIPAARLDEDVLTTLTLGTNSGLSGQRNAQQLTLNSNIPGIANIGANEDLEDTDQIAFHNASTNALNRAPMTEIPEYVNSKNPNDLNGVTISGQTLQFTQKDGSSLPIVLPQRETDGGSAESLLFLGEQSILNTYGLIGDGIDIPASGWIIYYMRSRDGDSTREGGASSGVIDCLDLQTTSVAAGTALSNDNDQQHVFPFSQNRSVGFVNINGQIGVATQTADTDGPFYIHLTHVQSLGGGLPQGFTNPKAQYTAGDVGLFVAEDRVIKQIKQEIHEGHGKTVGGAGGPFGNFVEIPDEDEGGGANQHWRGWIFNHASANNLTPTAVSGDFYCNIQTGGFYRFWDGTETDAQGDGWFDYDPFTSGGYWDTYTPAGGTAIATRAPDFADSVASAFQEALVVGDVFVIRALRKILIVGAIQQPAEAFVGYAPHLYVPQAGPVSKVEFWGISQIGPNEELINHSGNLVNANQSFRFRWSQAGPNRIIYGHDIGARMISGVIDVTNWTPFTNEVANGLQFLQIPAGTHKLTTQAFSSRISNNTAFYIYEVVDGQDDLIRSKSGPNIIALNDPLGDTFTEESNGDYLITYDFVRSSPFVITFIMHKSAAYDVSATVDFAIYAQLETYI